MQGKGVQGQPDVPGLSAAEMQRKVEEIVRDVTNAAFNRLVDELMADTAAENIGAKLDGLSSGRTLQAVLVELNNRQNTHAQKKDNPHAVTAAQVGAYTKQETDKAIDQKVQVIGAGDMTKAEYGGSASGVVAQADKAKEATIAQNSKLLSSHTPEWFAPPGMIAPYAGTSLPNGWLWCGGNLVPRTQYAALFSAIGTTYGEGDGSTTFALPDLRNRVVAMRGDRQFVGDKVGADSKSIEAKHLPTGGVQRAIAAEKTQSLNRNVVSVTWTNKYEINSNGVETGDGTNTKLDVRQPTIYLNFIIKY